MPIRTNHRFCTFGYVIKQFEPIGATISPVALDLDNVVGDEMTQMWICNVFATLCERIFHLLGLFHDVVAPFGDAACPVKHPVGREYAGVSLAIIEVEREKVPRLKVFNLRTIISVVVVVGVGAGLSAPNATELMSATRIRIFRIFRSPLTQNG